VLRREFRHVRRPLALRFVGAVVFVVWILVGLGFVGGEAEGRRVFERGGCEGC
jgi:hypothetical protein